MEDFNITYDNEMKDVSIANLAICVCAANGARRTTGVNRLGSTPTENVTKKLFKKEPISKGIKISQHKNGVNVEVYLIVDYGSDILSVAWDVQKNVKEEIENITEKKVGKVNIHIQGVDLPRQD